MSWGDWQRIIATSRLAPSVRALIHLAVDSLTEDDALALVVPMPVTAGDLGCADPGYSTTDSAFHWPAVG